MLKSANNMFQLFSKWFIGVVEIRVFNICVCSAPQVKKNNSPETINGTRFTYLELLYIPHLNSCVCDVIFGFFNLTDIRGREVSRISKWSWKSLLMTITGPIWLNEGLATKWLFPILKWRSLYRGMPSAGRTSALKVMPELPASTKRCWSSLAIVMDWPAPVTMSCYCFYKIKLQKIGVN